jgi:hypothetical protein
MERKKKRLSQKAASFLFVDFYVEKIKATEAAFF